MNVYGMLPPICWYPRVAREGLWSYGVWNPYSHTKCKRVPFFFFEFVIDKTNEHKCGAGSKPQVAHHPYSNCADIAQALKVVFSYTARATLVEPEKFFFYFRRGQRTQSDWTPGRIGTPQTLRPSQESV